MAAIVPDTYANRKCYALCSSLVKDPLESGIDPAPPALGRGVGDHPQKLPGQPTIQFPALLHFGQEFGFVGFKPDHPFRADGVTGR